VIDEKTPRNYKKTRVSEPISSSSATVKTSSDPVALMATNNKPSNTSVEAKFDSSHLDPSSYHLGMIYAFAEVVASGCKRLALSPAMTEKQLKAIIDQVRLIAREYDLVLDVDDDFLTTKLFNPEYTHGKHVIHMAAEQATIDEYKALKEFKRGHIEAGTLTEDVEREIAWKLGRLLSYSDEAITRLMKKPRF